MRRRRPTPRDKAEVAVQSVDLGFHVARMVRFYGFSWRETMKLPIRVFWALNREIPRLRADEALALIPATAAGGMGANLDKLCEQLRVEIGPIVEMTVVRPAKSDLAKLRRLMGGEP